jgi:hypothetical protein
MGSWWSYKAPCPPKGELKLNRHLIIVNCVISKLIFVLPALGSPIELWLRRTLQH